MAHRRTLVLLCLSLFSLSALHAQTIYYVSTTGSDASSGTGSWNNAFRTVQTALANAGTNSQIWVAKGIYYPDEGAGNTNNSRSASFIMKNNVALYGGFAGNESQLNQRNWQTNVTILSGDIDQNDGVNFSNNNGNSYHVVCNKTSGLNNTAILDGFSITAGNANSSNAADYSGGGIYNNFSSPTLRNCNISGNNANYGGGIYNNFSSPTLTNCSFSGNNATSGCGAIEASAGLGTSSTSTLTNCGFWGNYGNMGGAILLGQYCSFTLINCSFSGNKSASYASGIININNASLALINCILWGDAGEEIFNPGSANITYCIIQGLNPPGTGCLNGTNPANNPWFVQQPDFNIAPTTTGNLHLQHCSQSIDKGNNAVNNSAYDLDGNPRINGGTVDFGAYETQNPFNCPTGNILYVNKNATGANNGTSWANAFINLQDALTSTCSNINQIWVAKGTYYPDEGCGILNNDGAASFVIQNGLSIYGGFAGTETQVNQRNWQTNLTILSGDIDQNDSANFSKNSNNSCHVISNNGLNNTAVLDGFTIKAGNANSSVSQNDRGGGMYNSSSSPLLSNCTFLGNNALQFGGGIYNSSSSPILNNCSFLGNNADREGGGMDNSSSSPTLNNCSFSGNNAATAGGGMSNSSSFPSLNNCSFLGNISGVAGAGIYNYSASPALVNCIFSGNNSATAGGGMYNENSSSPTLTNCSFSGNNSANAAGGIYNSSSTPTLTNCILWGDGGGEILNTGNSSPTISFSLVQGQNYGGNNPDGTITANNPLFIQQPDFNSAPTISGNLRLQGCSPVINKGNDAANTSTQDLDSNPRKVSVIDLGAFEFQFGTGVPSVIYVKADANGSNNGSSWTNAYNKLQDALSRTSSCTGNAQIWVAKGTYYPDEGAGKTNNDRTASFVMKNNLAIYGGFAGTETILTDRNWKTNVSILSGDIDQNDGANFTNNGGNSYHVLFNNGTGLNNTSILDGFTITSGNANGSGQLDNKGAGMYNSACSPALINCIFSANNASNGGAIADYSSSSPSLNYCSFSGNNANAGGGIYNNSSSPAITNCSFSGNGNSSANGGGILNDNSSAGTITNCSFSGNKGSFGGGVANFSFSSPTLINCSFSGNSGSGIFNLTTSNPVITNSILWGDGGGEISSFSNSNPIITYSLVQGQNPGGTNLDGTNTANNPLFIQQPDFTTAPTTSGNLRLKGCSPVINKGNDAANSTTTDLDFNPRKTGVIDLGGYEYQKSTAILYVNANATGANDGSSWTNAYNKLQDALATSCYNTLQIWVAKGTYYPDEGGGKTNNDRSASFTLKNNVAIYAGFAGTETNFNDRNWQTNMTILSGDIDQNDATSGNTGNSYHVVNSTGANSSAIISGFTIMAGNASAATSPNNSGGGMYNSNSSPNIANCTFITNSCDFAGAAIYNTSSSPGITNCNFQGNRSYGRGGGVSNNNSSPVILNCSFSGNQSYYGGGLENTTSSPAVINCSFSGNRAVYFGGGICNQSSSNPIITNSIIWGNTTDEIYSDAQSLSLTYSLVKGHNPAGTGNMDGTNAANNPLFIVQPDFNNAPTTSGNLRLQSCSPVINKGNDGANGTSTDLDNNPRKAGIIDLGSYEFPGDTYIIYVNASATGLNNGSSWTNAYSKLQDALAGSCPNPIWVAKGTYYPDEGGGKTNNDRTASFVMKNNVAIYGGFAGTETQLDQRNWQNNITILSGDIDQNDGANFTNNSGNSYHVINNDGVNNTAIIDGFLISAGNANGNNDYYAGGMYNRASSPTVSNCTFTGNVAGNGGGMVNHNTTAPSNPAISNCIFTSNASDYGGGAITNINSSPTHVNCTFSLNKAKQSNGFVTGGALEIYGGSPGYTNCSFSQNSTASISKGGGAVWSSGSNLSFINCVFLSNAASVAGGGMYSEAGSSVSIINCSFSANKAGSNGGALVNLNGNSVITNSILWGDGVGEIYNQNTTQNITYSLVQGMLPAGTGNLDGNLATNNPMFLAQPDYNSAPSGNGNLRLQPCSPVIDKGSNAANNTPADLDNNPRRIQTIELGAYEFQYPNSSKIIYVDEHATGVNSGTSWANAFTQLQDALRRASSCNFITEVWVAKGSYYPDQGTGIGNNDRTISFALKTGLAIYGGFNGTETQLSQRNWRNNPTILSGDVDQNDGANFSNVSVNSYHVIFSSNVDSTAILDGFIIKSGYANGNTDEQRRGAGMYNTAFSNPSIRNCTFQQNWANLYGGGIFNLGYSPSIVNTLFAGNQALNGAGMYNLFSSPRIYNCTFAGNNATQGGGMYNEASSAIITNCSFAGNQSPQYGGAIYNYRSSFPVMTNCVLWENTVAEIWNENSDMTINYSLIRGQFPTGIQNLDGTNPLNNPLFKIPVYAFEAPTTTNYDLRVWSCSPLINRGDGAANPTMLDLDSNARVSGGKIDIGAYEYQYGSESKSVIYVRASATGKNTGTSWNNAYRYLQDALAASRCANTVEIWVANGIYYPDEGQNRTDNDRNNSFTLQNGVSIYGGFNGTETQLSQRNWKTNLTILSGDIDKNDGLNFSGNAGNSYHVIKNYGNNLNNSARLDGVTITGGFANGNTAETRYGGGVHNYLSGPAITNCTFQGNHGGDGGGGIFNSGTPGTLPKIDHCIFAGNVSNGFGSGFYNAYCSFGISDCIFLGNQSGAGGAIFNYYATLNVVNCSVSGNKSGYGTSSNGYSLTIIRNCIFWGNTGEMVSSGSTDFSVTYSLIEGDYPPGFGNLDGTNPANDPLFFVPPNASNAPSTTGNLRLQGCSPAINKGNNSADTTSSDLDGNVRRAAGTIDLGAYESQPGNGTTSYATDYFRAVSTGNWNMPCTWESSPDNLNWHAATITPDFQSRGITVQNGFIINVTSDVTIGPTTLNPGAKVNVSSGVKLTVKQ